MLNVIKVKITSVDMDCFQERDFHPTPDMVGMSGYVLKVNYEVHFDDAHFNSKELEDEIEVFDQAARDQFYGKENYLIGCYVVVLENGKKVEMMDFEIEQIF